MPINIVNIDRKLAAIQAKDIAAIVASHLYIRGLGTTYTKAQVQAWLDARSNVLTWIRTKNVTEVNARLETIRNSFTGMNLTFANSIIAKQYVNLNLVSDEDFSNFIELVLIIFALENNG